MLGAIIAIAALALAGCGFRPLYGERAYEPDTAEALAAVAVAPIPDRVGQLLRNRLLERLRIDGHEAPTRYRLDVVLGEVLEDLAIAPDDTVTRTNLRLSASFFLRDIETNTIVYQDTARIIAAYNVLREDYANLIAQRDARARATRELADEIQNRLAVYFSRQLAQR